VATPSNCGKFLKLYLPSQSGNTFDGRGNDPGYGKNDRDDQQWEMDNPQPSPKSRKRYGCSSQTKCRWVALSCLRYSRTTLKEVFLEEIADSKMPYESLSEPGFEEVKCCTHRPSLLPIWVIR
jgi:hypothetical protein